MATRRQRRQNKRRLTKSKRTTRRIKFTHVCPLCKSRRSGRGRRRSMRGG